MLKIIIIKLKGLFTVEFKNLFKKQRKFNAYNEIDKKMLKYINYKNGFYIDCGANDGVNQSNTWYYEKNLNWDGILIEPIPLTFNLLKKNRSKKNIFENCILVSRTFEDNKFEIHYNSNDTLTGSVYQNKKAKNTSVVKATQLSSILEKNKINRIIDFFSLDVEGYELEVLEGINFEKFRFKYILVETVNIKKLNDFFIKKNFEMVERLSDYNYGDRPEYGDYLFVNKSL